MLGGHVARAPEEVGERVVDRLAERRGQEPLAAERAGPLRQLLRRSQAPLGLARRALEIGDLVAVQPPALERIAQRREGPTLREPALDPAGLEPDELRARFGGGVELGLERDAGPVAFAQIHQVDAEPGHPFRSFARFRLAAPTSGPSDRWSDGAGPFPRLAVIVHPLRPAPRAGMRRRRRGARGSRPHPADPGSRCAGTRTRRPAGRSAGLRATSLLVPAPPGSATTASAESTFTWLRERGALPPVPRSGRCVRIASSTQAFG